MLVRLMIVSLLFSSISLSANEWQVLHPILPQGTQLSYLVVDAKTQQTLAQYQHDTLRTPASMQKLLTATAATLHLGADFRYHTNMIGSMDKLKNKAYEGDLRINFVGDPTFKRVDMKRLLADIKRLGIKRINGDIVVNNAHFSGYQWSNGQAWNDLGVCYTAPSNAIVINKNCVQGNLSVKKTDGQKARLFIPTYEPISVTSDVNVVSKQRREALFCDLELKRYSHNRYHLWGCMVPRTGAFPLSFSVNDPFHYVASIIDSELASMGVTLTGNVRLESTPYDGADNKVLASYQSPQLDELIRVMMKESDNLIADSLFKTIGASYFKQPGSFRNGGQAVHRILLAQGVDLKNAYLADGSGLSRHNLMSAEIFMSVLQFVYQQEAQLGLLSHLAIAGIDGTLKYHRGVRGKQFKGKIMAKTGSMKGVVNLLGVVKTHQGDRLFVLMLNGYSELKTPATLEIKNSKNAPKYLFQRAFFDTILNTP